MFSICCDDQISHPSEKLGKTSLRNGMDINCVQWLYLGWHILVLFTIIACPLIYAISNGGVSRGCSLFSMV